MQLQLGGNRDVRAVEIDQEDAQRVMRHTWWWDGKYAYTQTGPKGRRRNIRLHRFILNVPDNLIVDHINGDRTDYRRINLRIATYSQNNANSRLRTSNKSGYKGVSWSKVSGKWYATITHNSKQHNLGLYISKEDAARAYNAAALRLFGTFARINSIED